ncbi:osmotically-inducible protein OsmY [Pelomonas saccharophila]|uniref:Osmotically-inducible protein OsmY n=1 Tax=Roseateles saccharophilus TaxID=304 RepID=A0ABU1YGI9_ROSSA|nr:BON domain-containing protein [Roseateles saccharophilus]MDR7267964.1 osmotically-inducible protein OsmY [Roseateles saccharophilus]
MRSAAEPHIEENWRDRLPPYGHTTDPTVEPPPARRWRQEERLHRRSSAGAWLLALGLGAAITAIAVASLQDPRSVGTQLDDAVASVRGLGQRMGETVADSQNAAVEASRSAVDGVGTAIDDTGISLKVKTALAADPALSASRIEVTTTNGVVRLEGPAPDAAAKERATVLAGAPQGVRGVDNRLALPQAGRVVAIADGAQQSLPVSPAPGASR